MVWAVLVTFMRAVKPRPSWRRAVWVVSLLAAFPARALGHERFVKHDVLRPFPHDFFLHVDGNVLSIAARVCLAMIAVLFLWFRRHAIQTFVEQNLLHGAAGRLHT